MALFVSMIPSDEEKLSWRDGSVFKTFEALRPWLQWLIIIIMAVFVWYQGQRDTNAQNTVSFAEMQRKQENMQRVLDERKIDVDKKFEELGNKMVSKELFEERTGAIRTQVGIIDSRTVEILNRLPVHTP